MNVIRWRELKDVILVGHSYGGMIITGIAGQTTRAVKVLVYLDAFVPEHDGVLLFARANPKRMARFNVQIADGRFAVDPDHFESWTDDPDKQAWLRAMCTPHPIGCFRHGVTLTGREKEISHRLCIVAERNKPSEFWAEYECVRVIDGWQSERIDTKHDAMVEDASRLATLLHKYSRSIASD